MPDYKETYGLLFRAMSKAIEILQEAQQTAEEMYIASEDDGEKEGRDPT